MEFNTYQGGATDTFVTANIGDLFDIFVDTYDTYLDPNDVAGGFVILESFDNNNLTAIGSIPKTLCYC